MKRLLLALAVVFSFSVMSAASDDDTITLKANLSGLNEVDFQNGNTGPINTAATGSFKAVLSADGTSLNFTLTFDNLTSNILVSHIHFAPSKVSGGVMIFLCGGGGQPACPAATSATVTGTITAANVVGPTSQNVSPGDLATALRLIRAGSGYVNVHTVNFKAGEIRGQVHVRRGDGDRDDD